MPNDNGNVLPVEIDVITICDYFKPLPSPVYLFLPALCKMLFSFLDLNEDFIES